MPYIVNGISLFLAVQNLQPDALTSVHSSGSLQVLPLQWLQQPCGCLQARFPQRVRVFDGQTWEDWAQLMLAPTLFKDTTTFGLWAALASSGRVYSPHLPHAYMSRSPPIRLAWHWADVPVLHPDLAHREGLSMSDVDGVLNWLREH